jgi:hypothetical protein
MGLGGWLRRRYAADFRSRIRRRNNAAIVDLVGQENADEFWRRYRELCDAKGYRLTAAWGFNSIRLPMHFNLMTPKDQPGIYLESLAYRFSRAVQSNESTLSSTCNAPRGQTETSATTSPASRHCGRAGKQQRTVDSGGRSPLDMY